MREQREGLVFHLISAHEVRQPGRVSPTYYAACGAQVKAPGLSEVTECPHRCECELSPRMAYCEDCVREAIRLNHRAGVDAGGWALDGGLDLGDEVLLLILTRVHEGRIRKRFTQYFDEGQQVWAHVARALDGMLECDHLQLGEAGPDGSRPLVLTERELAAYTALRERQRTGRLGPGAARWRFRGEWC